MSIHFRAFWTGSGAAFGWLALAGLFFSFANGHWIIALFAWLAPLAMLRFTRSSSKPVPALVLCWLVLFVARAVNWLGLLPLPVPVFLLSIGVGTIILTIPYWVDRMASRRIRRFSSTLIFPLSCVAVTYLYYLAEQTTWGSIAYSQTDNLALLQLASVTGIWGMVFLVSWFASVANWCLERRWQWSQIGKGLAIYTAILMAVIVFGEARLLLPATSGKTVRVATIIPADIIPLLSHEDWASWQQIATRHKITLQERSKLQNLVQPTYDDLFARTRREAQAGARIVFWPEGSLVAFSDVQQQELIQRSRELARSENIYLGVSLALAPEDTSRKMENKIILVGPDGEIVQQYFKTHLVPVVEEPFTVPGSGMATAVVSPYGKLGIVICYDMDDPRLLRSAGKAHVDLLFAPSGDWQQIANIHARMAITRAVEEGFSLVRPANHGFTLAADSRGRILGWMDFFSTDDRVMIVNLPTSGVHTVYARIGDLFAWLCIVVLAAVLASAFLTGSIKKG